jgi:hypothetical protein
MGFEDPTLRAIEACPAAAAALGPPISRSYLGWSCGNAETEGSFGNASWTFPVTGSNGSGSVDVVAEMRGGPWRILSATVETSSGTWEVVHCSGGGPVDVVATHFDATVTTAIGTGPVARGTACGIDLGPGDGPWPCHVVVTCGAETLYGAGSTGYADCSADASGAITVRDGEPSSSGGDPTLDLRVGAGEAVLTDTGASGTWVLTLSFAPPGGTPTPTTSPAPTTSTPPPP